MSRRLAWRNIQGFRTLVFFKILFEKVVQQSSNHRDRAQLADLVPRWSDGRPDDVRSKLKLKTEQKPLPKSQPYSFSTSFSWGHCQQPCAFKHTNSDEDHGHRLYNQCEMRGPPME